MKLKRGDFVELKPYCMDRNRTAVVVAVDSFDTVIVFADTGEKVVAITSNLILCFKESNTKTI
tara:strand:- start:1531 stop:1719 length:189 start_codon:yes stop_codon:yes gene_type:complete